MTDIKIPEGELSAVIGHAIIEQLSAETRETLIAAALQHIMTAPAADRYGPKPKSPLQQAFNEAVVRITRETVETVVRESEQYTKIVDSIGQLLQGLPDPYEDNEFRNKVVSTIIDYATEKIRKARDDY